MKVLTTREQMEVLSTLNGFAVAIIKGSVLQNPKEAVKESEQILSLLYESASTLMGKTGVELVRKTTEEMLKEILKEMQDELKKEMENRVVHSEPHGEERENLCSQD